MLQYHLMLAFECRCMNGHLSCVVLFELHHCPPLNPTQRWKGVHYSYIRAVIVLLYLLG